MGRRLVKEKNNEGETLGVSYYLKCAKIFIGCGIIFYFIILWISMLPQDYEKYNIPLFFALAILFATFWVVLGVVLWILCKKSKRFQQWANKDVDNYLDKTIDMRMKNEFRSISNYRYIKKCLHKLYDAGTVSKIMESASEHYFIDKWVCYGASKGEWKHLNRTILPTVCFYKALKKIDPENAYTNTRQILLGLCETGAKVMNGLLKIPGMKSLFMWMLPKMALSMFGRESGFDYEEPTISKTVLAMNMTKCPYCKYAQMLHCKEITPIFCESDYATYGNLAGIAFTRNETLATGGKKCDFCFEKRKLIK